MSPVSPGHISRLLVVEDDDTIRETVAEALRSEGYDVTTSSDGASALNLVLSESSNPFELIVLDLMMPGLGGLDFCREFRRVNNTTPVLVVSARDTEADRVIGLELGADDYLVKPFGLRELVARCRALLRRSSKAATPSPIESSKSFANLCLYANECRVTRDGADLSLSPKEFKILEPFIQNPKRVWSRDQLLEKVWGIDFIGDTKTVDVHIRWLREKIEDEPSSPQLIRTVRGFGYRFG